MNKFSKTLFGGALVSAGIATSAIADNTHRFDTFGDASGVVNGPGKDYGILYDQSGFGYPLPYAISDQTFGANYPSYAAFMVDDFSTGGKTWNITSVHTFFTDRNDDGRWAGITSANLQFYKKSGNLPSNGSDLAPEYTSVPVTVIDHGTYMEVAATGLNIPELMGVNGDYWVGLTPDADFGKFGQQFHLQLDKINMDPAAWRNPGGAFGLGTDWVDSSVPANGVQLTDMAFYLDGDVVPAPGAAALLGLGGLMAGRRRR